MSSVNVVWFVKKSHLQQVVKLSRFSEEQILKFHRSRLHLIFIACNEQDVLGYMIYKLYYNRLYLVDIVVHKDYRHLGIGQQLINSMISKLYENVRNKITVCVDERNLDAQLFFKKLGFKANFIIRRNKSDLYRMSYIKNRYTNRISQYAH